MFKNDSKIRQEIKRLRKLSKKFPLLFARIGECYIDLGDLDTAEKVLLDGLRRHPDYITGYLLAGECYLYRGRIRDAEEIALKGLHKAPSHLGLLDLMRRIKKQGEEFEDLEKVNRSIRALDPLRTGIGLPAAEALVTGQQEQETSEKPTMPASLETEMPVVPGEKPGAPDTESSFTAPPAEEEDFLEKALERIAARDLSGQLETPLHDIPASIDPSESPKAETAGDEPQHQEIEDKPDDAVGTAPEQPVTPAQEPPEEMKSDEALSPEPETVAEKPSEPAAEETPGEAGKPEQTFTPPTELNEEEEETPPAAAGVKSETAYTLKPSQDQEPEVVGEVEVPPDKPAPPEPDAPVRPEPQTTMDVPAERTPDEKESPAEKSLSSEEPESVSLELKATADDEKKPSAPVQAGVETEAPSEMPSPEKAPESKGEEITLSSEENDVTSKVTVEVAGESSHAGESQEVTPQKPKSRGRIKKRLKELTKLFAEEEGKDAFGLPLNFEEQSLGDNSAQKSGTIGSVSGYDEEATRERAVSSAKEDEATGGEAPPPKKPKIATKTLGELYATQKKYDEAIEIYEKLIEKDPTNEAYIQRLAELKKRRAEALG